MRTAGTMKGHDGFQLSSAALLTEGGGKDMFACPIEYEGGRHKRFSEG